MSDTTPSMRGPAPQGPLTLREWARDAAPGLEVVSASVPESTLEPGALLATFRDSDAARSLVLTWERIEPADNAVAFVALGADPGALAEQERPSGPDPEGVGSHTITRVLAGGLPGAAVGAAAVGLTVGLTSGWDGGAIGGALGGAAFGAVAGGFIAVFRTTGWGEAYTHSFVDPDATEMVIAAFQSSDSERGEEALEAARSAAADGHDVRLARVGDDGRIEAI